MQVICAAHARRTVSSPPKWSRSPWRGGSPTAFNSSPAATVGLPAPRAAVAAAPRSTPFPAQSTAAQRRSPPLPVVPLSCSQPARRRAAGAKLPACSKPDGGGGAGQLSLLACREGNASMPGERSAGQLAGRAAPRAGLGSPNATSARTRVLTKASSAPSPRRVTTSGAPTAPPFNTERRRRRRLRRTDSRARRVVRARAGAAKPPTIIDKRVDRVVEVLRDAPVDKVVETMRERLQVTITIDIALVIIM